METTHKTWVEGPAIDLLVAMKAIQPGDELKVTPLNSYGIPNSVYRATVEETTYDEVAVWEGRKRPAVCLVRLHKPLDCHTLEACNLWQVCRENIIAWKRPGTNS